VPPLGSITPGQLREDVWNRLLLHRVAAYPTPPHGHHPNFVGVEQATARLLGLEQYRVARTLLVGPDQVLKSLRRQALAAGKTLILPHPDRSHVYLKVEGVHPRRLQRIREVRQLGTPIRLEEVVIDLVVIGCVAVDERLGWLGKGYGFPPPSLEVVTPWATLAHPLMVFPQLPVTPERYLNLVVTPDETLVRP